MSLTNGTGITGCQHVEEYKYLSPCTKPKLKWIKVVNIKPDILTLIEKKVLDNFECIGTGDDFLNTALIIQALRLTI